jgi:hypothetical protein
MTLQSKRELEITRRKLRSLEQLCAKTENQSGPRTFADQLTLRSLRRTMNQLKEEIARFEARSGSAAKET